MIKRRWIVLAMLMLAFPFCARAQELSPNKRAALDAAIALEESVRSLSMELWNYSETALLEEKSAELLAGTLEAEGFTVERGVAGMPTAFVASYGSGSPVIGILAEFDALPGVGNAKTPGRSPREDEVTSGHGCGHNLFGAASVAGAIAIKRTMEAQGIAGTIRLFGTPAEETVVGKVYMVRDGVFDGLDAVIDWHPSDETKVKNQPGRAMNNFTVEFFGQAAHASADPWNGRSALDAVEMMNYGVNMMREHVKPTARIHYVIPNAGEAPNVVPEYAKVWYYVRDINREEVEKYYNRILRIAEGAALATDTTHKVFFNTGVHKTFHNRPMQERIQQNLELVGGPDFSEEDQSFARAMQEFLKIEQVGFKTEVEELADELGDPEGGSTDVAEVSWITPTAGFRVATAAYDIPWHSWATTACHGTEAGVRGAMVATKTIALTGIDLLTDAELLAEAKKFFDEGTKGKTYNSPLPEGQAVPLPDKK